MNEVRIKPSVLSGEIAVPPSKSAAHRLIIAAGLSGGGSVVKNVAASEDICATIGAVRALGSDISLSDKTVRTRGFSARKADKITIDCNESGSTLRFMIPIALALGGRYELFGRGRLLKRPLDAYLEIFRRDWIDFKRYDDRIELCGRLAGGEYRVRGDVSSQFVTGLLFALPLLPEASRITLTTPLESAGYVDMTLEALSAAGICVTRDGSGFYVRGGQSYRSFCAEVEGDYSQAAFYLAANAMGSSVKLTGLSADSRQGDREIIKIIEYLKAGGEKTIDVRQIPDLVPIRATLATQCEGVTSIVNAGRLRIKESDRLSAVTSELTRMGADVGELSEGLVIRGKTPLHGAHCDSHNDHRIAMAVAVAATVAEGETVIDGADCVKKSYGNFWEDYFSLKK